MVSEQDIRQLFGGAITAEIPAVFTDVSQLREVPDNQEVFAHADTDRSVIIELLELQKDIPAHVLPAQFHLDNLAEESGAVSIESHVARALPDNVSIANGTHRIAKYKDAAGVANEVDVYVACVRLSNVSTDLLIVFNDPRHLHPDGSSARSGSTVQQPAHGAPRDQVLQKVLSSLKIKDWSLFEGQ